jgi:hypothetical protein
MLSIDGNVTVNNAAGLVTTSTSSLTTGSTFADDIDIEPSSGPVVADDHIDTQAATTSRTSTSR